MEAEERKVVVVVVVGVGVLIVERLANALEVLCAKAARERRLRREIEPTTDPVKEEGVYDGSVVWGFAKGEAERV